MCLRIFHKPGVATVSQKKNANIADNDKTSVSEADKIAARLATRGDL